MQKHLGEARNHGRRLEDVFRMPGFDPKAIECPAIDGIVEEAEAVAGEHYEMARYGTLIASGQAAWPE